MSITDNGGDFVMVFSSEGKPLDYEAFERWTLVGYERGMRSRKGER
jgi:hypothetical protein